MHKPNLIIIEGPDRVGKGTLIDTLRNEIESPFITVIHSSKPPKNIENPENWSYLYNNNLLSSIKRLSNNDFIILDRSYIGEYIYGPLYRGIDYTLDDFKHLDKWIYSQLSDKCNIILITLIDNESSLAYRSDGLAYSENIYDLAKEVGGFKEAHYHSSIENKILINWRHILEPFEKHLEKQAKIILDTLQGGK